MFMLLIFILNIIFAESKSFKPLPHGTWEILETVNDPPQMDMGGHSSCMIGNRIFTYGGAKEDRSTTLDFGGKPFEAFYSTMQVLDLSEKRWDMVFNSSHCNNDNDKCPDSRAFIQLACSEKLGRVYIFGGLLVNFAGSDELFYYDIALDKVVFIEPSSSTLWPSGRGAASLNVFQNKDKKDQLLLHGGNGAYFNDLKDTWLYDIESAQWTEIITGLDGAINPLNTIYKNVFYKYSGEQEAFDGSGIQGTWRWNPKVEKLDLETFESSVVFDNSFELSKTNFAYAAYCRIDEFFMFFGGDYGVWRNSATVRNKTSCDIIEPGADYIVDDVHAFDLKKEDFVENTLDKALAPIGPYHKSRPDPLKILPYDDRTMIKSSYFPVPRATKRSSAVCDEKKAIMYIIGGWGGTGSNSEDLSADQFFNNQVWMFRPFA